MRYFQKKNGIELDFIVDKTRAFEVKSSVHGNDVRKAVKIASGSHGDSKGARYDRVATQLRGLFSKTNDPIARMATAAALLKGKFGHFFWTGFYRLVDGELVVGPYQGALACQVLERHKGVCWAGIDRGETIIVPDVHKFPGHIACDSRSKSEIVVPVRDREGRVWAVLDADSDKPAAFDETDARGLEKICGLMGG